MTVSLGTKIARAFTKRFGGVTPDYRLSYEELEAVKAIAKPIQRRMCTCLVLTCVLAWIGLSVGLIMLVLGLEGPRAAPFLDERTRLVCLYLPAGSAFFCVWLGYLIDVLLLPVLLPIDRQTWRRYYASLTGWLPERRLLSMSIPLVALSTLLIYGGFLIGDRVDENGIASWDLPLERWREDHASVTAVECYKRHRAPGGIMNRPNLLVVFRGGRRWEFRPDPRARPTPDEIADFIAQRSGIQPTYGDICP